MLLSSQKYNITDERVVINQAYKYVYPSVVKSRTKLCAALFFPSRSRHMGRTLKGVNGSQRVNILNGLLKNYRLGYMYLKFNVGQRDVA